MLTICLKFHEAVKSMHRGYRHMIRIFWLRWGNCSFLQIFIRQRDRIVWQFLFLHSVLVLMYMNVRVSCFLHTYVESVLSCMITPRFSSLEGARLPKHDISQLNFPAPLPSLLKAFVSAFYTWTRFIIFSLAVLCCILTDWKTHTGTMMNLSRLPLARIDGFWNTFLSRPFGPTVRHDSTIQEIHDVTSTWSLSHHSADEDASIVSQNVSISPS